MKNVNLNRQVVNIKIGCEKGRKRDPRFGCLKVGRIPTRCFSRSRRWFETLCLDFRVTQKDSPLTIWRAIDLIPMGSLKVENRSNEPLEIYVTKQFGHPIVETVPPKSTISLTLRTLEKIAVSSMGTNVNAICFGQLRLRLLVLRGKRNQLNELNSLI